MNKYKKTVNFLFETGSLRKIPRSHMQTLLTNDLSDNIASHSFRVSIIALFLAKMEKANTEKVLTMALFHDLSESRSGDQNWVHKKYVKVYEDEIISDQIKSLPYSIYLGKIINEYVQRKTKESQIAKDADLLDQILLLKEYSLQGNKEADNWIKGKEQLKRLVTKSAKKLADEIFNQNPHEWWTNLWTSERR